MWLEYFTKYLLNKRLFGIATENLANQKEAIASDSRIVDAGYVPFGSI